MTAGFSDVEVQTNEFGFRRPRPQGLTIRSLGGRFSRG